MSERGQQGRTLRKANPETIQDKVLVGYQGWFTCAGDGEPMYPGHHGWLHWFSAPIPKGGRPNVDFWPDLSEYSPSELYPAPGLNMANGDQAFVFSSRNPDTVMRHFHWMALHGVDGAFLQRFAGQCDIERGNKGIRDQRDEVGVLVRNAAMAEGRVYAIMYDVSGVDPARIQKILEEDWIHLLRNQRLLDCPNYLRENGKAVVALWGFGFNGRNHTPELVRSIGAFFHSVTPGGVYLMAGVPGHWRTSTSDADRNPEFVSMWTEVFDAISPWTVGRYVNEGDVDRWGKERIKADADYLSKVRERTGKKVDYIPVVLPGGSGYNLSQGKWGRNDIKRNGGQFLWKQIYNARRAGVRTVYGAMWDEYDEGTVFMPVVSKSSQLPVHPDYTFLALDVDGYDLPSDWYMRLAGFAAEGFHGERVLMETFPVKELQDYWSTRPHYEDDCSQQAGHERIEVGVRERREQDHVDEAPPPYSVEELVQPIQSLALSDGRKGNSGASNAQLPSGPPPPLPVRSPSLATSSGMAVSPHLPQHSLISVGEEGRNPPPVHPTRATLVNVSLPPATPSASGRSPPPINISTRPPRPVDNSRYSSAPHVPPPSTRPQYLPGSASMEMPVAMSASSGAGTTTGPGVWLARPPNSSPPLSGGPSHGPGCTYSHVAPNMPMPTPSVSPSPPLPSWPGPQHPYAGIGYGHSGFPAPTHPDSEYNQSVSSAMGPYLPHQYESSPMMFSQPGLTPPPGRPSSSFSPHPPVHPQASGYYAPYPPGSSYGGAYNPSHNSNHHHSGGGGGTGGIAGKALDAVESLAGRDARAQLERGVKTLTKKLK